MFLLVSPHRLFHSVKQQHHSSRIEQCPFPPFIAPHQTGKQLPPSILPSKSALLKMVGWLPFPWSQAAFPQSTSTVKVWQTDYP